MPKIETYTANLSREGSTGSVRGKIPATLISAMGGDDGDVFEFQVNGKTLVGGRIITGKEARDLRKQGRQNFGPVVASKPAAVKPAVPKVSAKSAKRPVVKQTPVARVKKPAVKVQTPAVKSSKNKTSVAISKPATKGRKSKVTPRFSL